MGTFASVTQSRKQQILRIPPWWRQSNYLMGAERPFNPWVTNLWGKTNDKEEGTE
jgi:hypothetical protein